MLASTTGNITGIYDLSGGTCEYVAAFNSIDEYGYIKNFGWSGLSTSSTSTKYATRYYSDESVPSSRNYKTGDATYEVNVNPGYYVYAWFSDNSYSLESKKPFITRGGVWNSFEYAGVFSMYPYEGRAQSEHSFRVCLPGL